MPKFTCSKCSNHIPTSRHVLGYRTCMKCGEIEARKVKHTIAPMHKSNYMVFTRLEDLKGINNKGGNVK